MVLAYKAESIIEREALLSLLQAEGLEAITTPRDISRKISSNTVDLAYEGYSAIFDGFPIYVRESDLKEAQEKIRNFLFKVRNSESSPQEKASRSNFSIFYYCSIFSLFLPIILHFVGFFYLRKGFKQGEKLNLLYFVSAVVVYIWTFMVMVFFIKINWG